MKLLGIHGVDVDGPIQRWGRSEFMATPLPSIDAFIDLVTKSGIVEPNRFNTYLEKVRVAGGAPADAREVARGMVRDAILTQFQANQLLAGKWKGFFVGKYKILEKLGHGGMGTVYLAEHKFMKRLVAVKVLPASKAKEDSSRERFYREAKAIAALDHPNIVRAYDIDQEKTDGKELHFIVMEYVDGASLHDMVKARKTPLDPHRACHYVWQAANGLHHAHEIGLVHRDIKPGNLLVDRNGVVKLLDLGLARFFYDEEDNLTKKFDENVLGTADYLAPEQAVDSHEVDIRADIYSLGGTLYFMLTGKSPFDEGTVAQKLIWHQTRRPRSVREVRPEIPDDVVAILDKMMQKNREDRYQTPAELATALEPWARAVYPPTEEEIPLLSPAARTIGGASTVEAAGRGGFVQVSSAPAMRRKNSGANITALAPPVPVTAQRAERDADQSGGQAPLVGDASRPAAAVLAKGLGSSQHYQSFNPGVEERPGPPVARIVPSTNGANPEAPPAGDKFSWSSVVDTAESQASSEVTARSSGTKAKPDVGPNKSTNLARAVNNLTRKQLIMLAGAAGGIFVAVVATIVFLAVDPSNRASKDLGPAAPAGKQTLYVSKNKAEAGSFETIAEAIARANPGDTIIVRDQEVYEEALTLSQAAGTGKKDLTLEAKKAEDGKTATLRSPSGEPVLIVERVEGVTIRGFTLDGGKRCDDLVRLVGPCPNLTLDDLRLQNFRRAGVRLEGAQGTDGKKLKLQRLRFDQTGPGTGQSAIAFGSASKGASSATGHVVVRDCWFEGPFDSVIRLGAPVYFGIIERNVFTGGKKAGIIYPADAVRDAHLDVLVLNNTFHQLDTGVLLQQFPLLDSNLDLTNNLFYQVQRAPGALENVVPDKLERIVLGEGNVLNAGATLGNLGQVVGLGVKTEAFDLPTNAKAPAEFLRYKQDSKLAKAGVKGEPVGALAAIP